MKINTQDTIPQAAPAPKATGGGETKPIQDRNSTSLSSTVGSAIAQVSDTRVAKIQALTAAIKGGTYQPNAEDIADSILEDAEIDAKLASL